jgi:hypothetical protein
MAKQKTFTRLHTVETITDRKKTVKVKIAKYQKDGTKQVYFAVEFEEKKVVRTLFARKYSASSVARQFLKYKIEQISAT